MQTVSLCVDSKLSAVCACYNKLAMYISEEINRRSGVDYIGIYFCTLNSMVNSWVYNKNLVVTANCNICLDTLSHNILSTTGL